MENKLAYLAFLSFLSFFALTGRPYFIFFLFFLFFLFYLVPVKQQKSNLMEDQSKEKAEHLQKIKDFMENKDRAVNDDVQKLLGVSDATAERYLNELEKAGILHQKGEKKGVFYEKAR